MKIDIHWIESAQNALKTSGIVKNGSYPKAYKGYISSLSASIIQSGLVPALSIYENDNSEESGSADNNRALLIYAIVLLLRAKELLHTNNEINLLSDYIANNAHPNLAELHRNINRALIAIKLAIRIYKPNDSNCRNLVPLDSEQFPREEQIIKENHDYSPNKESKSNIGWLYYKDLYRDFKRFQYKRYEENNRTHVNSLKDITVQHEEKLFKQKVATICCSQLQSFVDANHRILQATSSLEHFYSFTLKTTYPGLLIGTGLNHGVNSKEDIKVGFQFDYTTGLPYIPGSSIKGALRSVFPNSNVEDEAYNNPRLSYISTVLTNILNVNSIDKKTVQQLGQQFFQENNNNDFLRDVFMDALITNVASLPFEKERRIETANIDAPITNVVPNNGYFIGNDYITPHKNKPLQEPIPIQFLKVLPEVTFTFSFRLNDNLCSLITAQQRLLLYKEILKDIGIGAKTNVGYGHLCE